MRKSRMVRLSAVLVAGAISLPLLATTTSASAANTSATAQIGGQLALPRGADQPQAFSVGSVSFTPSDRQGAMSANWTVDATTSASGTLVIGDTITINAPATTTFPSASHAYTVNGTTVTAIPTTAAGTVTIATPVAVAISSAISVVITGVINPAAGTYANISFGVSTSADTSASNPASGLRFGSVVSSVSFSPSSSVGAGSATWTVDFTTSANGSLAIGDTVTVGAPASTTFPSAASASKVNGTTVTAIPTTGAGTITIATPVALGNSTAVQVVITGVTNPAASSYPNTSFSLSTIADAAANPASGQAFSVGSVNTTTGLVLSSTSVDYGAETSEIFTVTVTGQLGDGYPEGTIAVYNSATKLCSATVTSVSGDGASATCSLSADELAGGSYSDVFATYSPGTPSSSNASFIYGTSSSTPAQAFSVGSVNTTTGLVLSSASVVYGAETSEIFTITVTGQSGDGYPEGTIAVYNSATKLCSATVTSVSGDGASATCSLSADELAGGDYSDVFATYSPGTPSSSDASFTYGTSSSTPPQAFSVFSAPTTTGLALSSPSVVYGAEISEIFTITVTGQSGDGYPEGTVAVYNSTTKLSTATLTPVSGDSTSATCSLSADELAGGDYSDVFATYSPGTPSSSNASYVYGTSSSTPAQAFSVSSVSSTHTTVSESPTGVAYGHESASLFSVTVTTHYGQAVPNDQKVTVNVGPVDCVALLKDGEGTCTIARTALQAGSYPVSAIYGGDATLSGSSGAGASRLSVRKDTTRITVSESPTNVTYGQESASVFSVTVTTRYGEAVPDGEKVRVAIGSVTRTVVLKNGNGTCTMTNNALQSGSYPVLASYGGDPNLSGSRVSELTVRKDTTRTTVSESPTNVTYGHESASVFSVKVTTHHGEAVPKGEKATVHVGDVSCTVVLKGGSGTCTIANRALPVGSYPVSATYGGDPDLRSSRGSSASRLTV